MMLRSLRYLRRGGKIRDHHHSGLKSSRRGYKSVRDTPTSKSLMYPIGKTKGYENGNGPGAGWNSATGTCSVNAGVIEFRDGIGQDTDYHHDEEVD